MKLRCAFSAISLSAGITLTCAASGPSTNPAPQSATQPSTNQVTAPEEAGQLPEAVVKALRMPDGDARVKALTDAGLAWVQKDPPAALLWSITIAQGKTFIVFRSMAISWGQRDPLTMLDWAMSHSPLDNPRIMDALHLCVAQWGNKDPGPAAAWAEKQSGKVRQVAYYSVADGWEYSDAPAAAEWAKKLPGEDDRRTALGVIVRHWFGQKPDDTVMWVATLPVADLKFAAGIILPSWMKTNPTKANEWLAKTQLSEADKEELLKNIK